VGPHGEKCSTRSSRSPFLFRARLCAPLFLFMCVLLQFFWLHCHLSCCCCLLSVPSSQCRNCTASAANYTCAVACAFPPAQLLAAPPPPSFLLLISPTSSQICFPLRPALPVLPACFCCRCTSALWSLLRALLHGPCKGLLYTHTPPMPMDMGRFPALLRGSSPCFPGRWEQVVSQLYRGCLV
jgi:hypothetical protein